MEDAEKLAETLRQCAATYVDELIRIAPLCGGPLTSKMRADTIAVVEGAMRDMIREVRPVA